MAQSHRIFIAFAIEDERYRDLLVGQARNNRSPFSFTDMSVKEPWSEQWKTNCRAKIRGCDGTVALLSHNTYGADGARWEIRCAIEERVPLLPVRIHSEQAEPHVPEVGDRRIVYWTWENIANWLNRL
jgi:hypothetical protein